MTTAVPTTTDLNTTNPIFALGEDLTIELRQHDDYISGMFRNVICNWNAIKICGYIVYQVF